ncbi:MAG: glycosyl hydrolase [Oligosphaeraceae bacterium]
MPTLQQLAATSDPTCSPAYFWFLNDDLTLPELLAQLHDMADKGVRALLVHPMPRAFRPVTMQTRMAPDYLTPDFLRLCHALMDEARRLGMHYWLYDEGGWPSGGACTLVSQLDPDRFRPLRLERQPDGTIAPRPIGAPRPGFYPGLLNPGVTDAFIHLTHDQYHAEAPDHFGSTIRLAFMDEASFGRDDAWAPDLDDLFRQRKGYDIRPFYPALLTPPDEHTPEEAIQARIDLADVRSQLFVERFVAPIQDWCHRHGLLSSGHFNIDHTPLGDGDAHGGHGHLLRALRRLDVPGIDVIWRQLFPGLATHHFPKYASSVARQLGTPLALSESAAVYGNGLTPQQLRWLVDFQAVRGITLFVLSAYPYSLKAPFLYTSTRPNFGPANPLWRYADIWHAHITRTCALLRASTPDCTTAVLYDARSVWAGGAIASQADQTQSHIAQTLLEHHADFDFVDDDALATATLEAATDAQPPRLRVGAMAYERLVIPTANRLAPEAQQTVQAFAAAGGTLLDETQLDQVPPLASLRLTDGSPACGLRLLRRTHGTQTVYLVTNEENRPCDALLHFRETTPCLRLDTLTGDTIPLPASTPDGDWRWHFPPLSSVLLVFGETPTAAPAPVVPDGLPAIALTDWTLQPLRQHRLSDAGVTVADTTDTPARSVTLGDWRPAVGDFFSGDARYVCHFQNPGQTHAHLNLGDVRYACTIRCNGKTVARRIWPPYDCDLSSALANGDNTLEIDVTNTLANALADPRWPAEWHERFPKCLTQYDDRERLAEADTLPSGLFGPVVLHLW